MKFRNIMGVFFAIASLSGAGITEAAPLRVVASVPCLGDMAREIGGERVRVDVLASGREDFHAVPARPSFLPRLHRADLLLSLGLDAEHAWLPALAAESRNPRIRKGGEGWIETYAGIEVLGVPARLDRAEGEQHPRGNPHYNIGPRTGAYMARNIAEAFSRADPEGSDLYHARLEDYTRRLDSLERDLRERGASLRGVPIVSYHPDVSYFADFYGMEVVGSLEPKPGVPPSAGHLRDLGARARDAGVRLVLRNQAQNPRLPRRFAEDIGAVPAEFLNMAGSRDEAMTWMELQEYNLRVLLAALQTAGDP